MYSINILSKSYNDSLKFDLKFNLPPGSYKVYEKNNNSILISGKFNSKGERDSIWEYRTINGILMNKLYYLDGTEIFRQNFSTLTSGAPENDFNRIYFLDTDSVSNYIDYDDTGQILSSTKYINGVTSTNQYYSNGALMTQGMAINGVKENLWFEYNENGILSQILLYEKGNLIEIFKF